MTYELPKLPYLYDSLEPYIDAETMYIHHTKHHAAYVNKLNNLLLEVEDVKHQKIEEFVKNISSLNVSSEMKDLLKFNGGGHYNHSLFWTILSSKGEREPKGSLHKKLSAVFGSFENFKIAFKNAAIAHLGSGWTWLCVDTGKPSAKNLFICSTLNHDAPNMAGYSKRIGSPILVLDMWEHSYYLKYNNNKSDYIDSFWHIVDWNKVAEYYKLAIAGHYE